MRWGIGIGVVVRRPNRGETLHPAQVGDTSTLRNRMTCQSTLSFTYQ